MTYICNLCPRKCNALRSEVDNVGGICGMPYKLRIARASKHFWEEPSISGSNGSGTIFFSGCQLKCTYCQNYEVSHNKHGKDISVDRLVEIFKELENSGVHNINLVSPTQFVPLIIEAFDRYKPNLPVVFNTGGYESVETLESLRNYVDIFLIDFKYWSCDKSKKYSAVEDYPSVAKAAISKAYEMVGPPKYSGDIMTKGVLVRHLLLPSATNDAIEIMKWIKKSGMEVVFSLMNQYTVMPYVRNPELCRKVTNREYNKVLNEMIELEIDGFVQDESSIGKEFIPQFDLSGV